MGHLAILIIIIIGFASIQDSVDSSIQWLEDYIKKSKVKDFDYSD